MGKGALAKVVPHQHQERRQLCHGSCTFGYSVQLDSAQPVWQMCCYSDWNRPNKDAPGLKRSGCNAIASQGDTVVPGQGVDTIRGLNPTYADRIETGMAATCCGTPFGQDPSGGSCASLGSPSPPPPAPPPLPSLSTTLLSPSPGCVGPEIQWPCLRKCHALGGTWPRIDYQLPAVLVCKKSCAPLCPPPMPPTPPPPSPCMDKNEPNDPEYCQKAVGTFLGKITSCKQIWFIVNCEQSCGFCTP